ncbi:integrator complex subunit 7, partial [Tachysurus ichikawai]
IPLESKTNEIEQEVEPHNDYFSTQFLLNFSVPGNHSVTVEACVVDESGVQWKTGPKSTVSIKSMEDPFSQQLRHQQAVAQASQRNVTARFQ